MVNKRRMKYFTVILILSSLITLNLGAQDYVFGNAVEYNDFIVNEQLMIASAMNQAALIFEKGTFTEINNTLDNLQKSINQSIEKVSKLPPYQANTSFRDAALALFRLYSKLAANEYRELAKIITKSDLNESDINRVNELLTAISEGEKPLDAKFKAEQDNFALVHGFSISPLENVKSNKDFIPAADASMDRAVEDMMNEFMHKMFAVDQEAMKSFIDPEFIHKYQLSSKDYKVNNYRAYAFLVQSYLADKQQVVVYIWGEEYEWINKLTFQIAERDERYYIQPSRFESNYLDPWHTVTANIQKR